MKTPNQFEIFGPHYKPETQYLTSEGYPLGTTCWYFEVKISHCRKLICGDTLEAAWEAAVAHVRADLVRGPNYQKSPIDKQHNDGWPER